MGCEGKTDSTFFIIFLRNPYVICVPEVITCPHDPNLRVEVETGTAQSPAEPPPSPHGETPLSATLKVLAKISADLNAEDNSGRTPLMLAVLNNDTYMISELLKIGVDINHRSELNGTALHYAVNHSNIATVKFLIKNGADVNALDASNNTPLHDAVRLGHLEVIDIFLNSGASIKTRNSTGLSPLDAAASSGSIEVLEFLEQNRVDVNNSLLRLLSIAVEAKHDALALWLLKKEADANSTPIRRRTVTRCVSTSAVSCLCMCVCACLPFLLY